MRRPSRDQLGLPNSPRAPASPLVNSMPFLGPPLTYATRRSGRKFGDHFSPGPEVSMCASPVATSILAICVVPPIPCGEEMFPTSATPAVHTRMLRPSADHDGLPTYAPKFVRRLR